MEVVLLDSPGDDTAAAKTKRASKGRERKSTKSSKKKNTNGFNGVESEEVPPLSKSYDDYSSIKVSTFDYSVENHYKAIDTISKLCGLDNDGFDDAEIARFDSNITFLREWRYFNYEPRVIRFLPETGHLSRTEAHDEITLSQFSAAMVPKCTVEAEQGPCSLVSTDSRKDFILYAGGLVWALDWCPRVDQEIGSDTKCEFIAMAAHPPDSTYHKLGAPLTGRGMIQIWCLLNCTSEEHVQASAPRTKQKSKKITPRKAGDNKPVRPRGRPRKNVVDKTHATDLESSFTQALFELPEDISDIPFVGNDIHSISAFANTTDIFHDQKQPQKNEVENKKPRGRPRKSTVKELPVQVPEGQFIPALAVQLPDSHVDEHLQNDPIPLKEIKKKRKAVNNENNAVNNTAGVIYPEGQSLQALAMEFPDVGKRRRIPSKKVLENDLDCTIATLKTKSAKETKLCKDSNSENSNFYTPNMSANHSNESSVENCLIKDHIMPTECGLSNMGSGDCHDLNDSFIPRVILCLGHDGKVAWDVKWRPNGTDFANYHRMGYLAVALGNGSIEVWEVPSPQVINCIFASRLGKDMDPRFVKLKPVFKCSKLNYGDRQSMPLIVEWSASPPHDLLLAGCHDGVVALWKFSTDLPSEDARPLVCFSADTGPIRALSWAPFEGDPESANVVITAGHGGLKFWDLRDPFRPLWDANPSQRFIYGLDWLPDPRCVILSYDDGTLRILSLLKAAYDVPVTGEPFSGTQHQGLHSFHCSSSAIWSIHVSRLTGIVAYCCADGTVLHFQLTHKAVEKDPCRNRAPHFLCGSLASDEPAVAVNTKLPSSPQRMKKSATEWANTPRSARTVVSNMNHGKRVRKGSDKCPSTDEQALVLCQGDESQIGEANAANNIKSKSKANVPEGFICGDGEDINSSRDVKGEVSGETEGPPPKIQSMYRVRWNMNKGSERWLCYGGAAGIVRCQEIYTPEIDRKLLKR